MTVRRAYDYQDAPITIDGTGLELTRMPDGSIEVAIDYPDPTSFDRRHTLQRFTTLTPEDWATLVRLLAGDQLPEIDRKATP